MLEINPMSSVTKDSDAHVCVRELQTTKGSREYTKEERRFKFPSTISFSGIMFQILNEESV